jgi:hypothetical protein
VIIRLLVGVGLLTLGRKLFWFFVGGIGFVAGVMIASRVFGGESDGVILVIGLISGAVGALLTVMLQKFALGLAGFLGGGYVIVQLADLFGFSTQRLDWLIFIVGGIIGAALIAFLFEWALIGLSSLSGAAIIAQTLSLEGSMQLLVLVVAAVFGVIAQAGMMGKKNKSD